MLLTQNRECIATYSDVIAFNISSRFPTLSCIFFVFTRVSV